MELADTDSEIDIWEEKVLGLTKSFVLYRGHSPARRDPVWRQTR
jgi:hypothetical protein